jgi:predicted transcriptional regulator
MFDRCIGCERLGKDCVPNLMALSFPDMMTWWKKRQALLDWTNQELADRSGIPVGTINRIRKGEDDPRYSTMRSIIHALMGGHTAEFPCQKKLDAEFAHIEELEKQRQELIEERNALLAKFHNLAELHRNDMVAIHDEYREEIALLKSNNTLLREKLESINH